MSERSTHAPHPGLSQASAGARALAVELKALEKQCTYAREKGERYRIKMAALDLLSCCGTPAPLVQLFRQLMKDDRTSTPPQQAARSAYAQIISAQIEATHDWDADHMPSVMNNSEVARAVESEMRELKKGGVLNMDGKAPGRTTIRKWRKTVWYRQLVFSYRQDAEYIPGRGVYIPSQGVIHNVME